MSFFLFVDALFIRSRHPPFHSSKHTPTRIKPLTRLREGYIGEYEEVDDHRSGKIVIQLNGRLNKTGVISPRYNVQLRDMEKWVVKLLPSRQFGYIVLTTSSGIMDHEEARRKHVSGKIIGFFY